MARNYQRLGNKLYARRVWLYSILVIIASLVIGHLLPESVPGMAVSLPVLIAMGQTMKQLQGPALVRHQHNQGQLESCWKALGISLLFMLAVLVMIIVAVELIDPDPLVSLDVQMNSRL